jgi:DNA-binding MarR family transcriptional regulator
MSRTQAQALSNGSRHESQAELVHSAVRTLVRNLLSVDDSMMDLPLRQLKVCISLYRRSRAMSDIGRELGLSPSAVTQVSNRLERRGLIERLSPDEDRRVRKLRLTRKGQQLVRSREEKQLRRIADALERLNEGEVDQLMTGLELLTRSCASSESEGE